MAAIHQVPSLAPPETQHTEFIKRFLAKTLRVTVTDKRVFVGQLKCTDRDCNLVLALTHEYRPPPDEEIRNAAATAEAEGSGATPGTVQMQFTSRFIGLVVIPGEYITKIEWEEYFPG